LIVKFFDEENLQYIYSFYISVGDEYTYFDKLTENITVDYYQEYEDILLIGDFNGNGLNDCIVADIFNSTWSMYSYGYSGGILTPLELRDQGDDIDFDYYCSSSVQKVPIDFNGNGKHDILDLSPDGYDIYEYNGSDFDLISYGNDFYKDDIVTWGDYNGDGNTDFFIRESSNDKGKIKFSTGTGFIDVPCTDLSLFTWKDHNKYYSQDMNGDGLMDLVVIGKGSSYTGDADIYIALSTGSNFKPYILYDPSEALTVNDTYDFFGDYNGDGNMDYLFDDGSITCLYNIYQGKANMLVESFINGLNMVTTINYKPLTDDNNDFYTKGTAVAFPLNNIQLPIYMVSSVGLDNGVGGTTTFNYNYSRAILHRRGRGYLGLGSSTVTNTATDISTVTTQALNTDYYYFTPSNVLSILIEEMESTDIASITYTNDVEHYGDKRIFPHVKLMHVNDYLKGTDISTTYTYNSSDINYGNLTSEHIKYTTNGYKQTIKNYEYILAGAWCPSKVDFVTIHKDRYPYTRYTRTVDFTYNDEGQVQTKITDGPKPVTTSFEYDNPFGLLTKVTNSAIGVEDRYIDYEYDTKGRFVIKATNVLDHDNEATYDSKTGNILISKDANGLSTCYRYDGFGRHVETTLPDGNMIYSSLHWDDEDGPSEATYYSLTEADGSNPVKTYYDILGRTLRTEYIGFNGSEIYVDKEYSSKGWLLREREPTFDPDIPASEFTTYLHDDYGRVTYINSPTSNFDIDYIGLTIKITNDRPDPLPDRETFRTLDELGLLISSTDANGKTVSYDYYSSGLPEKITSPGGAITTMQYDLYGNQTQLVDPNAGTYNYTSYNAFGELLTQEENSKTTTVTYDRLGRPLTMNEQEGTTTYTFDTKPNGIGMIASITGPGSVSVDYTYDKYSRLAEKTETIDGINFTESMIYDNYGRLSQLTYPSGFAVTYHYNYYHYLSEIKRADNQAMIWKAETMNERLQIEQFKSGNNLVTTQSFDLDFITGIQTGSIQNLQYEWDRSTGNLNWRKDVNRNLKEDFTYDNLNRLTSASIEGGTTMDFSYNENGNIESTTSVGIYSYESTKPHAVTSVTNPNNLISTVDQIIEYTSFNKVKNIIEDLDELQIYYGVDKERRKIEKYEDESPMLTRYYAHFNYEKDITYSTVKERHYISGSTGLAAIFEKEGGNENMYYIHKDHLGSLNCITDQSGALVQEMSFDAWGRRRNPTNWTYTGLPSTFLFDRGFTGHEHLNEFNLINMNGRMYDPLVGRFLSPDNFIQAPDFTQSFNRYSYAFNNPLAYIDPTGEKFHWWHVFMPFLGMASLPITLKSLGGKEYTFGEAAGEYLINVASFICGGYLSFKDVALPGIGMATGMIQGGGTAALEGGDIMEGIAKGGLIGGFAGLATMGLGVGGNELWNWISQGNNLTFGDNIRKLIGYIPGFKYTSYKGGSRVLWTGIEYPSGLELYNISMHICGGLSGNWDRKMVPAGRWYKDNYYNQLMIINDDNTMFLTGSPTSNIQSVRTQLDIIAKRIYSVESDYLGDEGNIIGLISGSNSEFRITSMEGSIVLDKVSNNSYTGFYVIPPGNAIDWWHGVKIKRWGIYGRHRNYPWWLKLFFGIGY
jgi:RHS repeat-associated protein